MTLAVEVLVVAFALVKATRAGFAPVWSESARREQHLVVSKKITRKGERESKETIRTLPFGVTCYYPIIIVVVSSDTTIAVLKNRTK